MKIFQSIIASVLASTMLLASFAEARSISSSRSSSSSRSFGISRPSAMSAARAPSPAPAAAPRWTPTPAPTYTPRPPVYSAPPVYTPRTNSPFYDTRRYNNGPSAGTVAGAAAAGALGGAVVGGVIANGINGSSPVVINNGAPAGAVAPGQQAVQNDFGAPQVAYQGGAQGNGGMGFWGFIWSVLTFLFNAALLCGLVALAYFGIKKAMQMYRERTGKTIGQAFTQTSFAAAPVGSTTGFFAVAEFMAIQRAFAGQDMDTLRQKLSPNMIETIQFEGKPEVCTVVDAQATKVYEDSDEISYRMKAVDTSADPGILIDEVWHYTKIGNQWKLDGIEQM